MVTACTVDPYERDSEVRLSTSCGVRHPEWPLLIAPAPTDLCFKLAGVLTCSQPLELVRTGFLRRRSVVAVAQRARQMGNHLVTGRCGADSARKTCRGRGSQRSGACRGCSSAAGARSRRLCGHPTARCESMRLRLDRHLEPDDVGVCSTPQLTARASTISIPRPPSAVLPASRTFGRRASSSPTSTLSRTGPESAWAPPLGVGFAHAHAANAADGQIAALQQVVTDACDPARVGTAREISEDILGALVPDVDPSEDDVWVLVVMRRGQPA